MKQLFIYFGLAYLISWTIWLPLYGHFFGLDLPVLPFNHAIGALGPLIASFLTTFLVLKKQGVKDLLLSCIQLKPLKYLSIALISPFLLAVISILIIAVLYGGAIDLPQLLQAKEFPEMGILTFFLYNLIFFGLGEEVGWRGFALPRLQNSYSPLASSIILTLFWALWHLPLFLYRPGYVSMDITQIIGWFLSLLTGSILLTWLYNSSRGSILICAVFHSTIDIAFTADFVNKDVVQCMGFLISIWGMLTIFILRRASPAHAVVNLKNYLTEKYG
jgi:uncharacterized protein